MTTPTPKGFSTVELMIAFALMSLVFGGVILADYGSNYWAIASETSNEGLYKAKTRLEELRAIVKKDFRLASSSPITKVTDASCSGGSLCYYMQTIVSDLSPCSKYVQAESSWQVQGYPTTTTSLFTNLTDANEAVNLGGDCPLTSPDGAWANTTTFASFSGAGTSPTGVDTLGGTSTITSSAAPYLSIAGQGGFISFANAFAPMDPLNAIDVARDVATGRTYGFAAIASTSVQLEILDLTDAYNPSSVTKLQLNSVDRAGSFPQGWRVAYYDRKVYITVRETTGPEFHVIDVSNPASPTELGNKELNTSVYGMVIRDVKQGSTSRRLAFLATTQDGKELMVLDVTDPANITELTGATTALPGGFDAYSVFVAGNTIYVGRISNSGPELYALNAANIFTASGGLPVISSVEIGGDVTSIRASDPYLFIGSTKSGGQLQIFKTNSGVINATQLSSASVSGYVGGIDMEGKSIYITSQTNPRLRVIRSQ